MARIRIRPLLIGLAAGLLVGVAVAPPTRWLLPLQLRLLRQPDAIGWLTGWNMAAGVDDPSSGTYEALARAAAHHPNDYRMQIGLARMRGSGSESQAGYSARLRALEKRFPSTPSVYANAVRMADTRIVRLDLEPEPHPVPESETARRMRDSEAVALLSDTAAGARLEPDNAYYPFMSAVALFRLHRDAEALAALERAGHCKEWREYYIDEITGQYALYCEAFGARSAFTRLAVFARVLFPHYANLRSVARVAMVLAGRAEASGDFARGAAIRTSLARCGSLMRVQSTSAIGTLVGCAIIRITSFRLGGVPDESRRAAVGAPSRQLSDERDQVRAARCVAYLRSHGQGAAASELEHANDQASKVRDIMRKTYINARWERDVLTPVDLCVGWVSSLTLLAHVLTILVALALFSLGFLSSDVREQRAVGAATGFSAVFGLVMGALTLVGGGALVCIVGLMIGSLAIACWYVLASPERRAQAAGAVAWMLGAAIAAYLVANTARVAGYPAHQLLDAAIALSFERPLTITAPVMGGALLPVLLVGCVIGALVRRRPLVTGTVRTFCACAPIVIALLVIAYGYDVIETARWDARVANEQTKWLQHEDRYAVERAGFTWPGM